jgi:hypothetical protein
MCVIIIRESLKMYVLGLYASKIHHYMDNCSLSVLTPCYDSWDYECTAELPENPLEHTLDDTDSGLEKMMYV